MMDEVCTLLEVEYREEGLTVSGDGKKCRIGSDIRRLSRGIRLLELRETLLGLKGFSKDVTIQLAYVGEF